MGKIIQIEVPNWVDENDLKKLILEKIVEEMRKDYVDMRFYNLYLSLKFPKSENVEFDLDEELKILKKMREKEKERVRW
ncbi:hypothetical protein DRP05_11430 [Archaeoglobales archaeon]|nr:MAG: hypothetical protein DRP05_11430 [Archaeoglobales archaeon]